MIQEKISIPISLVDYESLSEFRKFQYNLYKSLKGKLWYPTEEELKQIKENAKKIPILTISTFDWFEDLDSPQPRKKDFGFVSDIVVEKMKKYLKS